MEFKTFKYCNFIQIDSTTSLFDSLKLGLSKIRDVENIIINPIQVIPSKELTLNTISIASSLLHKENWSAVIFKGDKADFLFRDQEESDGKFHTLLQEEYTVKGSFK